jgi:hypothetical protein
MMLFVRLRKLLLFVGAGDDFLLSAITTIFILTCSAYRIQLHSILPS